MRIKLRLILFCLSQLGCIRSTVQGTIAPALILSDAGNYRTLIFNGYVAASGPPASLVLGQANFTSSAANAGGAVSAQGFSGLGDPCTDGIHLVIIDAGNNRALVWLKFPTQNFQAADIVLGQPDFSSSAANTGGISGATLSGAVSCAISQGQLFISDTSNSRILIWNTFPTRTGQPADVVVGQSSMSGSSSSVTQNQTTPIGITVANGQLFASEFSGNRILIWNHIPAVNNQPADVVVGQPNFTSSAAQGGLGSPNAYGFSGAAGFLGPDRVCVFGNTMVVNDQFNNRIMIWNKIPTSNFQPADLVIGQPNLTTNAALSTSARDINNPTGITCGGGRLAITDQNNNRILVWNSMPTQSYQAADFVVGQSNYLSTGFGTDVGAIKGPGGLSDNYNVSGIVRLGGY